MRTGNEKLWGTAAGAFSRRARRLLPRRTVHITRIGVGVVVLGVAIALAAFNTGTNLLYVMAATLAAVFLLSVVAGRANLNGLSVRQVLRGEPHALQPCRIQLEVTNAKRRLGSYGIALRQRHDELEPQPAEGFLGYVEAAAQSPLALDVAFQRRGVTRLERVEAVSVFPFGLIEFRARLDAPLEVVVFPRLVDVRGPVRNLAVDAGGRESQEKGHGVSLHSIREYEAGDPARAIHWKLAARGLGLMVREFEAESAQGILLVLEVPPDAAELSHARESFEHAVSVTASMARVYIDEGHEVALWTPTGTVHRDRGPGHLLRIYRALSLIDADGSTAGRDARGAGVPPPEPDMIQIWINARGVKPPRGHYAVDAEQVFAEAAARSAGGERRDEAKERRGWFGRSERQSVLRKGERQVRPRGRQTGGDGRGPGGRSSEAVGAEAGGGSHEGEDR